MALDGVGSAIKLRASQCTEWEYRPIVQWVASLIDDEQV